MSLAQQRVARVEEQVAGHKLVAPAAYLGAVRRDDILAQLLERGAPRIVLLQAPAGHGKSTLLQQTKRACDAAGTLTGWLSLDEADNDLTRLLAHLDALLANVAAQAGGKPDWNRAGGRPARAALRADWFITRLLALGRTTALFLDEFQQLTNPAVGQFFTNLCHSAPAEIRLFIGSRTLPDIGLSRLQVNNRARIFLPHDLCFSPAEVERFFSDSSELDLGRDEIDAIYARTEGWPAAVQLYRLALRRPEVRESLRDLSTFRPRQLAEYLADNVLALQPPPIQAFLLQTSVLARLSAPLCNSVLAREDAQQIMRQLEAAGLFLRSIDADGRWFQYHGLFASFLADQLREQQPGMISHIHQRAARWFDSHGMHEEAIHHAVADADYALAAQILDSWAVRLIAGGNLMTMERWQDRIPAAELGKHPDLVAKAAWSCIFLRRHGKLRPLLTTLKRLPAPARAAMATSPDVVRSMAAIVGDDIVGAAGIVAAVDVRELEAGGFHAFELGAAANLKGFLDLTAGDFESGREFLALARAHSERGEATFSWGYAVGTAGMILMVQGATQQALEMFAQGMADPRLGADESFDSGALVACYIRALYDTDQLALAGDQFEHFRETIAGAVLLDYLAVAFISMSRIHDVRGEAVRAEELLNEMEAIGHAGRWPRLGRLVGWERVRRALVGGEIERGAAIAARIRGRPTATHPDWIPFSEDSAGDAIGEIRLAIHQGRDDVALKQITAQMTPAVSQGRVCRQIKLLILDALAHTHTGNANIAHRSLRRALQLAAPAAQIRTFLEEGSAVVDLLHEDFATFGGIAAPVDPASRALREFLARLLVAAGVLESGSQGTVASPKPLEPLTERESEILRLLANGVSNKEIGRNVFVSENTVKFHLKNIYSKLGVSSRIQAIAAARQMRLL